MTTTGAGSAHPLVEHLREIQAGEHAKWVIATGVLAEVRQEMVDLQRRFEEAERALLSADVRLSAVSDTVRQAEEFLGVEQPSHPTADPGEHPNPAGPQSSGSNVDTEPKSLTELVLEALADGLDTPTSKIVAHAQLERPDATPRQITNCASHLRARGKVLIVGRGVYRLAIKEPRT
ncbi:MULTISPECIES: hypothetical protein [unclassified Streptomyces]|uniref:hypothetical protein n=1 Tax=unclassified Streptomyces TaxID=2593676 RepID=UPI002E8083BF|nr:hypothetical protein [Streptomyces sp. NBC_00503]WUD81860.1 hypothetical protein OG490_15665 [Streptomyces sp. NBC_00503]